MRSGARPPRRPTTTWPTTPAHRQLAEAGRSSTPRSWARWRPGSGRGRTGRPAGLRRPRRHRAGAGFFGVEFAPYVVGNLDAPIDNLGLPEGIDEKRRQRQLKALSTLNAGFALRVDRASVAERGRFTARANRLRQSPALKAFDLGTEKPATLAAYGGWDHPRR